MIDICKKEECTGCYACVNVCPKSCVSMVTDSFGELHPVIDQQTCIDCRQCYNTCPNNRKLSLNRPLSCYAFWLTDYKKRKECASGGAATAISEYTISKKKGVVFGTAYDRTLTAKIFCAKNIEDLARFKGSKYVFSEVGNQTFKEVKSFLKMGTFVTFIATPCQIAGLKSFLKKDYDNLLTVDLICHGTAPSCYLSETVSFLKRKKGLSSLTNIRFRGNDGNNFVFTLWDNNRKVYSKKALFQPYFWAFLRGLSLRENCYSCKYAKPDRDSDITIGDFIGIGKTVPFKFNAKNVSSLTVNTDKGKSFVNGLQESTVASRWIERAYEERLRYAPSLLHPFEKHQKTALFRKLVAEQGFIKAAELCLKGEIRRNYFLHIINYWTYLYRIPRKVVKIIFYRR